MNSDFDIAELIRQLHHQESQEKMKLVLGGKEKLYSEPLIKLKDADVKSMNFYQYKKRGLIFEGVEDSKNVYLNLIEFTWLCVIKELFQFGFKTETIAKVKASLFTEMKHDFIYKESNEEEKKGRNIQEAARIIIFFSTLISQKRSDARFKWWYLSYAVFEALENVSTIGLRIKPDGTVFIVHDNVEIEPQKHVCQEVDHQNPSSYVYISLSKIISGLVYDIGNTDYLNRYKELDDIGQKVIRALKEENLKQIIITPRNGKKGSIKIEVVEEGQLRKKDKNKALNIISNNQYKDIQLKSRDDSTFYYTRKRTI